MYNAATEGVDRLCGRRGSATRTVGGAGNALLRTSDDWGTERNRRKKVYYEFSRWRLDYDPPSLKLRRASYENENDYENEGSALSLSKG
jgi:hypothetical protein